MRKLLLVLPVICFVSCEQKVEPVEHGAEAAIRINNERALFYAGDQISLQVELEPKQGNYEPNWNQISYDLFYDGEKVGSNRGSGTVSAEFEASESGDHLFEVVITYVDGFKERYDITIRTVSDSEIETWWSALDYEYCGQLHEKKGINKKMGNIGFAWNGSPIGGAQMPSIEMIPGLFGHYYVTYTNKELHKIEIKFPQYPEFSQDDFWNFINDQYGDPSKENWGDGAEYIVGPYMISVMEWTATITKTE